MSASSLSVLMLEGKKQNNKNEGIKWYSPNNEINCEAVMRHNSQKYILLYIITYFLYCAITIFVSNLQFPKKGE